MATTKKTAQTATKKTTKKPASASLGDLAVARCGQQHLAVLTFPFDVDTAVYKIANKMFAIVPKDRKRITLKIIPEDGPGLIEQYACIEPGYHTNKRHWVTVTFTEELPLPLLYELIDDSYRIVVEGLPKKLQKEIAV
jgi:predicted DNA-binding protein (MmcQ/YjbR family)